MAPAPPLSSHPAAKRATPHKAPLAKPCAIASLEAADLALAELGRLPAIETRLQAACDEKLEAVRRDFSARMIVDGVKIADRRKQLVTELQAFAVANRPLICVDGKKSRALNHGPIGFRLGQASLAPIDGESSAGEESILCKLVELAAAALDKLALLAAGARRVCRLQVTFDRQALLKAFDTKELTAADLSRNSAKGRAGRGGRA